MMFKLKFHSYYILGSRKLRFTHGHIRAFDPWSPHYLKACCCIGFGCSQYKQFELVWLLKVIVVGVGTMNYMHTPEQIVGGILEIVKTCHDKQPQAEILVMVCRTCDLHTAIECRWNIRAIPKDRKTERGREKESVKLNIPRNTL